MTRIEAIGHRFAGLGVVLLCSLIYATPEPDRHWRSALEFCDFGHVLASGLITCCLYVILARVPRVQDRPDELRMLVAALAAVGLGTAVEVLQGLTGGNGDPGDVIRDSGGAVITLLVFMARLTEPGKRRLGLLVPAVGLVGYFIKPTATAVIDELHAWRQFPVLVDFKDPGMLSRFSDLPAEFHASTYTDANNHVLPGLLLHLPAVKYPGFSLSYFPGDWRGWQMLVMDLALQGNVPVTVNLRLDDALYRDALDAADRYDAQFTLRPGFNKLSVSLAQVKHAPQGREFDLGRVRLVLMHGVNFRAPADLILGSVRLQQGIK